MVETCPEKERFLSTFNQALSNDKEEFVHQFLSKHAFLFAAYFDLMNPVSEHMTGRANIYGHHLIHSTDLLDNNCAIPYYPVFSKVRIAERFVTDFVLADVGSRGFVNWILIELEPPTVPPFTQQSRPSMRLASALNQIQDWRKWIRENVSYARTIFPGRRVRFFYRIIIGRRKHFSDDSTSRLEEMHADFRPSIEIMHYDRLLDTAKRLPANFYAVTNGNYFRAFSHNDIQRVMQHFPASWLDESIPDSFVDELPEDEFPMPPPP